MNTLFVKHMLRGAKAIGELTVISVLQTKSHFVSINGEGKVIRDHAAGVTVTRDWTISSVRKKGIEGRGRLLRFFLGYQSL